MRGCSSAKRRSPAREGNLVFTGVEDDPETLGHACGRWAFAMPHHVADAIRGWHHGRIRATRSARARELLTKLVPALLDSAGGDAPIPMRPSRSSTASSPICRPACSSSRCSWRVRNCSSWSPRSRARRRASPTHLARAPATLDALIDADFLTSLPPRDALDAASARADGDGRPTTKAALDAARRFAKEQIFRVGVQIIEGTAKADAAGPAFANIAESVIGGLAAVRPRTNSRATAGRVPGGALRRRSPWASSAAAR